MAKIRVVTLLHFKATKLAKSYQVLLTNIRMACCLVRFLPEKCIGKQCISKFLHHTLEIIAIGYVYHKKINLNLKNKTFLVTIQRVTNFTQFDNCTQFDHQTNIS